MEFAKTVDEAMDLLKSSVSDPTPKPEVQKPAEEPNEIDVDIIKAQDIEAFAAQIKDADDFMVGLVEHQEANIAKLAKGLEGNMNATHAVLSLFKGFSDRLDTLAEAIDTLAGKPQPRRSVLSKAEAADAANGVVGNNEEEGESEPIRKADIVGALRKAHTDGKCTAHDVVKADTGLGGGHSVDEIPLQVIFKQLSEGGQAVIKELVDSRS